MSELSVIQKTYDFIQWYVPILNRLPRHHKFTLGDRAITKLYDLLEFPVVARALFIVSEEDGNLLGLQ